MGCAWQSKACARAQRDAFEEHVALVEIGPARVQGHCTPRRSATSHMGQRSYRALRYAREVNEGIAEAWGTNGCAGRGRPVGC